MQRTLPSTLDAITFQIHLRAAQYRRLRQPLASPHDRAHSFRVNHRPTLVQLPPSVNIINPNGSHGSIFTAREGTGCTFSALLLSSPLVTSRLRLSRRPLEPTSRSRPHPWFADSTFINNTAASTLDFLDSILIPSSLWYRIPDTSSISLPASGSPQWTPPSERLCSTARPGMQTRDCPRQPPMARSKTM